MEDDRRAGNDSAAGIEHSASNGALGVGLRPCRSGKEHAKSGNDGKSGLKDISFQHDGSPQVLMRFSLGYSHKF
jgi:hypothetical protein